MLKNRLISCLIVREGMIVQSLQFKRFLPVGTVIIAIEFMKNWDVDEIVLLDITATRDGRTLDLELISNVSRKCFVPLTVGGGIRSITDIQRAIRAGADKISVNTAAITNPSFITEAARVFGSQCVVVSMDVRKNQDGCYEVFSHSGKRATGMTPVDWGRKAESLGAGEIFLTSIDRDGSKQGYDIALVSEVALSVNIPVIVCGGIGKMEHFAQGILQGKASAVAAGNIFHYVEHSTIIAKAHLKHAGIDVRLSTLANYKDFRFDADGRILKKGDSELEEMWLETHRIETI